MDIEVNNVFFEIKGVNKKEIENIKNNEKYTSISKKLNNIDQEFYIFNYKMFCDYLGVNYIQNFDFYIILRKLLKENKCKINQSLKPGHSPKTIQKIDNDFQNNPNITIFYKGEK